MKRLFRLMACLGEALGTAPSLVETNGSIFKLMGFLSMANLSGADPVEFPGAWAPGDAGDEGPLFANGMSKPPLRNPRLTEPLEGRKGQAPAGAGRDGKEDAWHPTERKPVPDDHVETLKEMTVVMKQMTEATVRLTAASQAPAPLPKLLSQPGGDEKAPDPPPPAPAPRPAKKL